MLTSDLKQPVMSQTSVLLNLLHALNIVSDLGIQSVGADVQVTTVSVVLSSVQEPDGHAVGARIGDDLGDLLPLLLADLTSALLHIDLGEFAHQVSESSADALNCGQRVGDSSLAFDVGVEYSDDELELGLLVVYETLTLFSLPWLTLSIYNFA